MNPPEKSGYLYTPFTLDFVLLNISFLLSPIYLSGNIIGMFTFLLFYPAPYWYSTLPYPFNRTVQDQDFDQPPSDDELGEFGDSDIEAMEDEERNAYAIFP